MKNNAFTLAEVLITLAIIGVVAAMVIPALQTNVQEEQYNKLLKKFYADLSQALIVIQAPGSEINITENGVTLRNALCTALRCSKKDTVENIWGVMGTDPNCKYKNYKSSSVAYTDLNTDEFAAVLENGMYIANEWYRPDRYSFQLYVDINGPKPPNMYGKDLYQFEINNKKGKYIAIPTGGLNTFTPYPSRKCLANQTSYSDVWPCTYYRLYMPDQMP